MGSFVRSLALALTIGGIACTVTTVQPGGGGSSSGSTAGASADQVNRCHAGCDKMKFFNCSSASELSACYSDCDSAAPKQIDVFIACAENSICDPQCRTNLYPAPAPGSSGFNRSGGTGVSASTCQSACDKIITKCSLAPVSKMQTCLDACTRSGYQYQIDCVINNACNDIASRCGSVGSGSSSGSGSGNGNGSSGGTDPALSSCQAQCDFLQARQCLTAQEQSTCRADCATITGAKRDTFIACAEGAGQCPQAHDCYSVYIK